MVRHIIPGVASALAVAAVLLSGCSGSTPAPASSSPVEDALANMEPVVLTFSDSNVETAAHGQAIKDFMAEVTESSGGKITFDSYWAGTLHPGTEALTAIQSGLTDITYISPGQFAEQLPAEVWLGRAAVLAPDSFPQSLVAGSAALAGVYQSQPELLNELATHNARPLAYWQSAPFDMLCTKPVENAEEASGTSVRTGGGAWIGDAEALGMTNVFLPITDLFEAVQRGIVECANVVPSVYMTTGLWDAAKYYVPAAFTPSSTGFVMSESTWASLPVEAQRVLYDAIPTFYVGMLKGTMAAYERWAEESPAQDVEFLDPAELNEMLAVHHEDVLASLANDAPVENPKAVLSEYSSALDEWVDTLNGLGVPETGSDPASILEAYASASKDMPWDDLREAIVTSLAPYRP